MTYKQAIKTLMAVAGLVAGTVGTKATNITVPDYTGPQTAEADSGISGIWGPSWGWKGGPFGVGLEDNETEAIYRRINSTTVAIQKATVTAQKWDLEAMTLTQGTSPTMGNKLFLVGGYDFSQGLNDGRPGDLFIKIGGVGSFKPVSPVGSGGTFANGSEYDFVVRLSNPLQPTVTALPSGIGSSYGAPVSVDVIALNPNSTLLTVINDDLGSNPWRYGSGGTVMTQTTARYYFDAAPTDLAKADPGFVSGPGALHGDTDTVGGTPVHPSVALADYTNRHNVLQIDIDFLTSLLAPNTTVGFSYTMECGNDQLKGVYGGSPRLVPDGGATLMLLGSGLSALCFLGRRCRK